MGNDAGWWFEDFRVGQRFTAGPRVVTQDDLEQFTAISGDRHPIHWDIEYCRGTRFGQPLLHGPFGIAIASGLLHDLGIFGDAVVAMRSVTWEFVRPMFVGDEITMHMVVTRCRAGRSGSSGMVHRAVELVDRDGVAVQTGTSSAVMLRRGDPDRAGAVGSDPGSIVWAEALRVRLSDDDAFRRATAAFDGAIGFRVGEEHAYLRVVHGRIVSCGGQSDAARRFTVVGSELAWTELLFAARNDFIARATAGQFGVHGDVYEYLRLTKALHVCLDHARAMAVEAASTHGR